MVLLRLCPTQKISKSGSNIVLLLVVLKCQDLQTDCANLGHVLN